MISSLLFTSKSVDAGIWANEIIKARRRPHDRPEHEFQAFSQEGLDVITSLVTL